MGDGVVSGCDGTTLVTGLPAPNARGSYRLPDAYVAMATRDAAMQMSKAGVRLAAVLNKTLGGM